MCRSACWCGAKSAGHRFKPCRGGFRRMHRPPMDIAPELHRDFFKLSLIRGVPARMQSLGAGRNPLGRRQLVHAPIILCIYTVVAVEFIVPQKTSMRRHDPSQSRSRRPERAAIHAAASRQGRIATGSDISARRHEDARRTSHHDHCAPLGHAYHLTSIKEPMKSDDSETPTNTKPRLSLGSGLSLLVAAAASGGVTLHLMGDATHTTYLGQWGLDAGLFQRRPTGC